MAQIRLDCPHCDFPTIMVGSYSDIDSIDCPKCGKRVYLESNRKSELTNDQRAAFSGWTNAASPNSVSETFEESEPEFVTRDGVTTRIVRRVFRRVVRRTVQVARDGSRVEWEVDWSWISYFIYGLAICLLGAVLIFGLGQAILRPFGGVDRLMGKVSDLPTAYLDADWHSLRYLDVDSLLRGLLSQSTGVLQSVDLMRSERLAERRTLIDKIYESRSAAGIVCAISCRQPVTHDQFGLSKPTSTHREVAIYRFGGYFVFFPSSKLVVCANNIDLAKKAIDRSWQPSKIAARPADGAVAIYWVRWNEGATTRAPVLAAALGCIDEKTARRYAVESESLSLAAGASWRIHCEYSTKDPTVAQELCAWLNESASVIRTFHMTERASRALRADSPEHAALTLMESGAFAAKDRMVEGEWTMAPSALSKALKAADGGYDFASIRMKAVGLVNQPAAVRIEPGVADNTNQRNDALPRGKASTANAAPSGIFRELVGRGMAFGDTRTVEQATRLIVDRFGKDRTVIVQVRRIPDGYPHLAIVEAIAKSAAGEAAVLYATSRGGDLDFTMAPIVDLPALAGSIAFGQVDCDSASRTLIVQVTNASLLPHPKRPLARTMPAMRSPTRLTEARVAQLLQQVELRKEHEGVNAPLGELADSEPIDSQREAVCAAVLAGLQNGRQVSRDAYSLTLATWATAEHVPDLVRLLDSRKPELMARICHRFAEFKDERTVLPLARHFESNPELIGIAFENIGDAAENTVIGLLDSSSATVAIEAVRVLKVIGGKNSLGALEKLRSKGGALAVEASDAITIIAQNS